MSDRPIPRFALRPDEAADSIGISRSQFYDVVMPELRKFKLGQATLIPCSELERWVERQARRASDVA
jgi:predicted DNA-binding transcriptional regulator AlpA